MEDNNLSELEIELFNATFKFLNKIVEEEKYNGALDVVIRKSLESKKYGVYIGIRSNLSEQICHNCSLKYYENYKNQKGRKISFEGSSKEKPYNEKYREFILNEIPECKQIEIV